MKWDKTQYTFPTFEAAKKFLLDELWWLGQDLHHEDTLKAWEAVVKWQCIDGHIFSVKAGDPPALYWIIPKGIGS